MLRAVHGIGIMLFDGFNWIVSYRHWFLDNNLFEAKIEKWHPKINESLKIEMLDKVLARYMGRGLFVDKCRNLYRHVHWFI